MGTQPYLVNYVTKTVSPRDCQDLGRARVGKEHTYAQDLRSHRERYRDKSALEEETLANSVCSRLCSCVPSPAQRLLLSSFPLGNFSMKFTDLLHEPDVWLLPEILFLFICPYVPLYWHCFSFIKKFCSP